MESETPNQREQQSVDTLQPKQGYESASTAHKEVNKTATRLKRKLLSFQREELMRSTGMTGASTVLYVDPEKDETENRFAKKKSELQAQGIVLKKDDVNSLHPHSGKQAFIDAFRFLGCFIYLTDMSMKISYFRNTKWISTQVRELWIVSF